MALSDSLPQINLGVQGAVVPTRRRNISHSSCATIDLLKDTLGDRLISRFGPVNWPPRSCDLTPLDYFLWGYVKSLVYADKPQTLDHLEDNIRRVIVDIRPQMLEKVIENWTSRLVYIRAPAVEVICQKSYLKLVPSHVNVCGTEIADSLVHKGSHKDSLLGSCLTFSEIASRVKQDISSSLRHAPVHQCGHTHAQWPVVGIRVYPPSPNCNATQAVLVHIMTCIGCRKSRLLSGPARVLHCLKTHGVMDLM
ncbi:hypothetical protein TNCV_3604351 [Trichonephila clavipes]|nr:hypothetical protein TNCV_3604351 [Trichonephila clavipes]